MIPLENKNIKDITGQKFGKLTVIKTSGKSKSGNIKWLCKCECGNTTEVVGSKLRNGHTKSCGCLKFSEQARGYSATRLYRIWTNMHRRCYDSRHDKFKWYGNKGITICNEWHQFINFRTWALANGYSDDLSIDRIDSKGIYEPSNCRWQTQKQQMNNVSSNKILYFRGKKYTQSEFADNFNLSYHTVRNRIRSGWDLEKIVNTPVERKG